MKKYRFIIIIAVILFFIPFFWLKPGEMNLGGDSGRLYFYDPATYLNLRAPYNYLGSSTGIELTFYICLPYVVLLFLLKLVFQSPTILISLVNGLTLSVAFFSIYLIVKELLKGNGNKINSKYTELSSILAGLFYILSQISIHSGWEKPIITFNQLFLNPLMAFLLLKFMLTQKMRYLISALLTTFVFTSNFSLAGAPPFFAFYPITIIFLFLYAKFIRKVSFRWKFFIIGIVLFLFIHSFHLVNSVSSVFFHGSPSNSAVFAEAGEINSRNGLSYFIAVASSVKFNRIWMSLAQDQNKPYFAIFIIFPTVLVFSFFLNRGKTLLLTGLFFLIFFYFASAITETGFFIYKQFFRVPGFSMFRNFNGQWLYAFFFFYTLLLGQALATVTNRLSKRIALFLFAIFGATIIGFGLPLLTGSVSMPIHKYTGIRYVFSMDSIYEQVLQYFKSNPIDGKVLMLPLTDPGYQILQGKNGGIYKGLPTISYLGGKSEFGGYETLRPFQDIFLTSMQDNDYETLKRLLSAMNIKWIFYNSDPYIYSEPFKSVSSYVSQYAPKDQEEYKSFIEKLPITKVTDFGDRYHIYSVNNNAYLPHIFATEKVNFTNNETALIHDSNFQEDMRQVVVPVISVLDKENLMVLYGLPKTFLTEIQNNSHLHKHMPFVNRKLNDLFYPFIVIKEKFDLARAQKNPDQYLDYACLLFSKRVAEIVYFGVNMDIGRESWREPLSWEINKWFSYNSWNASLVRYENQFDEIIAWIENSQTSNNERIFNRIKVKEQLYQHEITLLRSIYNLNKEDSEKRYLLAYINKMFERLYKKINILIINPSLYVYSLPVYANREGKYEVYLQDKDLGDKVKSQIAIKLGEQKILKPIPETKDHTLLRFTDITLDNKTDLEIILTAPFINLVKGVKWNNSGIPIEGADDITALVINNGLGDLTDGLTLEIPNWIPESVYLISFDYNTHGDDFIFSFVDKKLSDSVKKVDYKLFFEKRLNAKSFKTHQSIVYAEPKSLKGFLRVVPFSPKNKGEIQIKNLIVQKIDYPELVFKKNVPDVGKNDLPHLTFSKINSTKYVIDVKGATDAYTLVFLESFSENWKLFDIESNDNSFIARISKFVGRAGKLLISPFIKDKLRENVIAASYFNGEVKEDVSTNTFIESKTFETWGKNTVSDSTHAVVDGYANGWYIRPKDMGGKTDYRLILELRTQRLFYPAILLSLITVVCILLYSIKKILWSKKR